MAKQGLSEQTFRFLCRMQANELTEHIVYTKIGERMSDGHNKDVLLRIAADEKKHAAVWKSYTELDIKPHKGKAAWLVFLSRIFGFTFVLKKMESGEDGANTKYEKYINEIPEAKQIALDEAHHEAELLEMLDEERLQYVGSMVLGLSDALVEISGTLAGLTFALQNTRLIALSGLITGISATLSMASSEYLSAKSDGRKDALKSSTYTGIAYLFTVALMVLPYLLLPATGYMTALAIMLAVVVLIIFGFTYYISVAKGLPFKKRFAEMAGISLSVSAISFVIGILVKKFLGISI